MPAAMSLVFDFAGEDGDNKMIMALIDTILCPFILIAITLGGLLAETVSLTFLFRILGMAMLTGFLIIIFLVKNPHQVPIIDSNQ